MANLSSIVVELDKEQIENIKKEILEKAKKELVPVIDACKMAYRKHCLNDDSVGWEELDCALEYALCNVLGNDGFTQWLKRKGIE